jgi:outer membrane protein
MRRLVCLFFFFSLFSQGAVTLKDAYHSALEKTESVPLAQSRLNQTQETVSQAFGAMLPSVSLFGSFLKQHSRDSAADSVSSNFLLREQFNSRVGLTQPLFRGGAEYAGISSAKASRRAGEASVTQARVSLFASVSTVFYQLMASKADVANLASLIELTRKRVKELSDRSAIGRTREGEVLAAEAQLAVLLSQHQAAISVLERAKDSFALGTGLPRESALEESSPTLAEVLAISLEAVDVYLEKMPQRPDIVSLAESVSATDSEVSIARSGHFPSLDFTANYYFARAGIQSSVDWDLGVTLTLPLFQGGTVNSATQEAIYRRKEQELLLAQGKRSAESEIRLAYERVKSGREQFSSLENAVRLAERNYQRQVSDYRLGLVNNLEVIQAMNTFQETKRSLDQVRYEILAAWDALQASVGKLF